MRQNFQILFVMIFLCLSVPILAISQNKNLALDLQNVSIQDALHIMAKYLQQNIVISPEIQGTTTLHLQHMSHQEAFDLLLTSHGLIKHKIGHTWFITSHAQFTQQQQEELKLQAALAETAPLSTHVLQIHYAKAEDIALILQDNNRSFLSKRGGVRVDSRTNTLCIQDTQEHLWQIHEVIKKLDIPVQQVLIEARLASIDNDFERELGINFAVNYPSDAEGKPTPIVKPKQYSLAIAHLVDGSQLDVQLAALEDEGHGELISSPSLFTANQQTASIESGEEIPYQEVSDSGGTAVAFKKAVLSLKVTPQVMPSDKVLLHLQVNQDRPSNRVVLGVPAISTRQIATNVLVENGKTIVLGGIYESNQEQAEQRIPFLGKIPLVGWLFKQQNVKANKRELLIFVTPKIISATVRQNGTSKA
ncbi:MAG: type IV pilus secretin PilQ [Gammaproteobacteria bacterium]